MVIKQIVKKINWNCIGKMKQFHFIGFQLTIHDWVSSSFRLCWPHDEILGVFCRVGESVLLSVLFSVLGLFLENTFPTFLQNCFSIFSSSLYMLEIPLISSILWPQLRCHGFQDFNTVNGTKTTQRMQNFEHF